MAKKAVLVHMPLAMHTKLKWRARQEKKSMARIIRGLIQSYLEGDIDPPTSHRISKDPEWDIYDELAAKVDEAVR